MDSRNKHILPSIAPQTAAKKRKFTELEDPFYRLVEKSTAAYMEQRAKLLRSRLEEASIYLKNKEYQKAIEATTSIINDHPHQAKAYFFRGVAYHERKQFDKSKDDFKKAESLYLQLAVNLLSSAEVSYDNADKVILYSSCVIAIYQTYPLYFDATPFDAYYYRGMAHSIKKNNQEVINNLTKALLAPSPHNSDRHFFAKALHARGIAYLGNNQYQAALEDLLPILSSIDYPKKKEVHEAIEQAKNKQERQNLENNHSPHFITQQPYPRNTYPMWSHRNLSSAQHTPITSTLVNDQERRRIREP